MRWLSEWLFFGIIYLGIRVGLWIVKHVPRRLVYLFSDVLADISYYLCQKLRKRSVRNLTIALGDRMDMREPTWVVRKSLRNFFRGIVEIGHALSTTPEEFQREILVVGREHMEKALAKGKGVIALSAHLGNFFLVGGGACHGGLSDLYSGQPPEEWGFQGSFCSIRLADRAKGHPCKATTDSLL